MQVFAFRAALARQLVYQRQDGVADDLGFGPKFVHVQGGGVGARRDGVGRRHGDDAQLALHAGQRHLCFDIAPHRGGIVEHRSHRGGAEHVFEQGGFKDGNRHKCTLYKSCTYI
ncbi:hypothetical protein D3C72_1198220 [compost metagenome]